MIASIRTAEPTGTPGLRSDAGPGVSAFSEMFQDITNAAAIARQPTGPGEKPRGATPPAVGATDTDEIDQLLVAFRTEAALTPAQRARRDVT